jgi:hypothetical protein
MTTAEYAGVVVQPNADHTIDEKNGRLTYNAKTLRAGSYAIASFLMTPLILVMIIAVPMLLLTLYIGQSGPIGIAFVVVLVTGGAMFGLTKWGLRPRTVPVIFDADSITVNGRTYLLDHVSQIRWRASAGYSAPAGAAAQGAAIGHALSGQIYIQYGDKEIPIITQLHPDRVQVVYYDILRFLREMGREYDA